MKGKVVHEESMKTLRFFLWCSCIILPLAPFAIWYLIKNKKPTDCVAGHVVGKRKKTMSSTFLKASSINTDCYITIKDKEFFVSRKTYDMLNEGDFVKAYYRKNLLYYFEIIDLS